MKSTALLREDHKRLLRALNVLEEMMRRIQADQDVSGQDVELIVDFLRNFGDRHHQGKEEDVLFPELLQDREQKNYSELSHLILDHDRDRSLIDGLQDSTLTKKTSDFVYSAGRLIEILRNHVQHEDTVLLPLVDATLSPSEDERVALDMKSYDRQWQDRELAGLLIRLDNLESKYVGKGPNAVTNNDLGEGNNASR